MVSEARRPAGRRLELPSVSRRHRVLLGLRRLRRLADGAAGWTVGATGVQRERRDNGDGTTTHRYYQEDVHDFAWTTSPDYLERTARFEHADAAAGRDAAAAAAGARGAGRAAFRRDAHDAEVLRRMVRRLSVRPHHDRRSGVPERRRRHGVSDAVHRRHALARARARDDAGRRHRPRGRPPVLVRHRRQQRVRGRVDGRRVQHLLDGARDRAGLRSELPRAALLRRIRSVGVQRHRAQRARPTAIGLPATAATRQSDAQSTPSVPLLSVDRRQHHLQQDRAVAEHDGALARMAGAAARSWPTHFAALEVQAPEAGGLLRDRQRGGRPRPRTGSSTRCTEARTCSTTACRT